MSHRIVYLLKDRNNSSDLNWNLDKLYEVLDHTYLYFCMIDCDHMIYPVFNDKNGSCSVGKIHIKNIMSYYRARNAYIIWCETRNNMKIDVFNCSMKLSDFKEYRNIV